MNHFWPTLPFKIPGSQGLPLWWDITWWVFQIVVMVFVIWLVTRWAVRMDRLLDQSSKPPEVTTDGTSHSLNG